MVKRIRNPYLYLLVVLAGVIAINIIAARFYTRWDLTKEKRYTLTTATRELLENIEQPVTVEVFLEGENLPAGIRSLQKATREMLQDMRSLSGGKVNYKFIDINEIKNEQKKEELQQKLVELGLLPTTLQVNAEQGYSEKLIYPGLAMYTENKAIAVNLLENQLSYGTQGSLDNSVNFLEYKLASTLQKLLLKNPPVLAFEVGHGELSYAQLDDLGKTLNAQNYAVGAVNLKEGSRMPDIDILVIAKPTQPFEEAEKFKIDQFIMNGGKVLWLIDPVIASLDSFGTRSSIVSVEMPLNLTDQLFRYGARINPALIGDLYCNPIPLMAENSGDPKPVLFPFIFHPILRSTGVHPIVKNLDPVAAEFAGSIDTIRVKDVSKTVLLTSSQYTRIIGVPFEIFLEGARVQPEPELFNRQYLPVAVLLEGKFPSAFTGRVTGGLDTLLPAGQPFRAQSVDNRMIVISDGDVAANDLDANGNPMPLGYYKYTKEVFANRDFVLNCIEYLLDNSGLLEARNRETRMKLLDKTKVNDQKGMWQVILLGGPLILLGVFALIYNSRRKRRYAR